MYTQNLALNKIQLLIYHKIQNQPTWSIDGIQSGMTIQD